MAVAQWVRRSSSGHRVVQAEGSSPGGDYIPNYFSAMIYILMDFSDIVTCNGSSNVYTLFDSPGTKRIGVLRPNTVTEKH